MPETIREQVVSAFATKVSAQRCARLDSDSDLPARAIWDSPEDAEKTQYGAMQCALTLGVESLALVDSETFAGLSQQANAMLGDLIQAATSGDNTLGGLCRSIEYQQSEFVYPDDGTREIEVLAAFKIVYQFAIGDPFTTA